MFVEEVIRSLRFGCLEFAVNPQDDFAQAGIIDVYVQLTLEFAGASYLQDAIEGVGCAGRDLVGRLALRTEAATLPSAGRQADDLDGMAGAVMECKGNRRGLADGTARNLPFRLVHDQSRTILRGEILPYGRAQQNQTAQKKTDCPNTRMHVYGLDTTSPPERVDNAGRMLSAA